MWITISDEQARRLPGYWRVRSPVQVVPNRLRIMSEPPGLHVPPDSTENGPLRVVYLGRFSPNQKGLDWLVNVLADQPPWASDYLFTFQGAGQFLADLEALARQLGPTRVRVLPWGDPAQTLAVADVLILTSRFEGLPLVAIEAIWAGVPVVATVESGLTGVLQEACLVPFGDTSRLQAALERMRDPARRQEAVTHAREKLRALLSDERYRASIRGVTEELATLSRVR
jgi:glycosyltransferase involved in cell wall biosynthesis